MEPDWIGSVFKEANQMERDGKLQDKKDWAMPKLTVYGDIEKITFGCNKTFGPTDGLTLMGAPIQCAS